ncbi:MAG: DAK2 domain-containing protein [Caldilineaceae bacterium]
MAEVIRTQAVVDALARAAALLEAQSAISPNSTRPWATATWAPWARSAWRCKRRRDAGRQHRQMAGSSGDGGQSGRPVDHGHAAGDGAHARARKCGKTELTPDDLVTMFRAAAEGMQERGKAKLGDKTILDAIFPAADAFAAAVADHASLAAAGGIAVDEAAGRDAVTPLRSRIGRAGWASAPKAKSTGVRDVGDGVGGDNK